MYLTVRQRRLPLPSASSFAAGRNADSPRGPLSLIKHETTQSPHWGLLNATRFIGSSTHTRHGARKPAPRHWLMSRMRLTSPSPALVVYWGQDERTPPLYSLRLARADALPRGVRRAQDQGPVEPRVGVARLGCGEGVARRPQRVEPRFLGNSSAGRGSSYRSRLHK